MALLPTNIASGGTGHISHSNQAYGKLNNLAYDIARDFGATGGADDTTAIQAAINAADSTGGIVYIPPGTWIADGLTIPGNNITIVGAGWDSVLKHKAGTADNTYLLSVNPGTAGTSDPTQNTTGLILRDLQLLGTVAADGGGSGVQHIYLLNLNAASDVLCHNVLFKGWRGDAVYLGSSNSATTERHNERIRIIACTFDGVSKVNRNGVTIIDGTDVLIRDCQFKTMSSTTMPGAIDIEPDNNAFARLRNIRIMHNDFYDIGGNVGAVCFNLIPTQASLTTKTQGILIEGNTIRSLTNTVSAIFVRHQQTPTVSTDRNNFTIRGNNVLDCPSGTAPVYVEGVRGMRVERNQFANSTHPLVFGFAYAVMDVLMDRNEFVKIGTTVGTCISIYSVTRLRIEQNVFDTTGLTNGTYGPLVAFDYTASPASVSNSIDLIGNRVVGTTATNISVKAASHTLTASTNWYLLNDTTLLPDTTHFAKQSITAYAITTGATTVDASLVAQNGTVTLNTSGTGTAGALTVSNGTIGQIITFDWVIGGTLAYVAASTMKFAGGAIGAKSTTTGWHDSYMMRFDGTNWNELSRSLAVR